MSSHGGRVATELTFGQPQIDMGSGLDFDDGGGLFADDPGSADPLGEVPYPGNFVGDTRADVDSIGSAFQARAKAEADRFRAATDSEYWCCVIFETREQKETFLKHMGWMQYGMDKYLDGVRLAEHHKITLPSGDHVPYVAAKPDPKLNRLALPME